MRRLRSRPWKRTSALQPGDAGDDSSTLEPVACPCDRLTDLRAPLGSVRDRLRVQFVIKREAISREFSTQFRGLSNRHQALALHADRRMIIFTTGGISGIERPRRVDRRRGLSVCPQVYGGLRRPLVVPAEPCLLPPIAISRASPAGPSRRPWARLSGSGVPHAHSRRRCRVQAPGPLRARRA